MTKLFLIAAAAAAIAPAFAAAAPAGDARTLVRAVETARKGAVVRVPAGEYDIADLRISRDMTLIGDGEVVFHSTRKVEKGLLVPGWDVSFRVENITFRGAVSYDQNGAGIRHDGADLTVVDCRFIDNENGILATGDDKGAVEIVRSAFIGNGHGDGYSHGVYVSSAARLIVSESRFEGTKIGHHVKSLAGETTITESVFDDAKGRTSYAVDASRGGAVTISGNSFVKASDADNNALFNYDLSRGGEAVALRIIDNDIVNRHRSAILLRNNTGLAPVLENNEIRNEGRARMTAN